uniref:Uncharacterized protein n=1 Tax=Ditylenchus dipsaci TaxID=166011 RepID=A0A915EDP0_9BILA
MSLRREKSYLGGGLTSLLPLSVVAEEKSRRITCLTKWWSFESLSVLRNVLREVSNNQVLIPSDGLFVILALLCVCVTSRNNERKYHLKQVSSSALQQEIGSGKLQKAEGRTAKEIRRRPKRILQAKDLRRSEISKSARYQKRLGLIVVFLQVRDSLTADVLPLDLEAVLDGKIELQ